MTNIIKNATEAIGAVPPGELGRGRIDVIATREDDDILIDVIDNGIGIDNADASTRGGGRGLANIRARSEALGGSFTLHSDATGTVARLAL